MADRLRNATTAHERFAVASDYLRKVRKNSVSLAEVIGDGDTLARLDAVEDTLAAAILTATENIKVRFAARDCGTELSGKRSIPQSKAISSLDSLSTTDRLSRER